MLLANGKLVFVMAIFIINFANDVFYLYAFKIVELLPWLLLDESEWPL